MEDNLKEQIAVYSKLQSVSDSEEFNTFFDLLIKTVADKMVWAFTSGKDGDNIKDWNDFCKVRGEIVARLQPIQEIKGSDAMVEYLTKQLDDYYKKQM